MIQPNRMPIPGLKPKDLVGVPWRVAFALQDDGWWLRQDVIWHKPAPMPESVRDRCTKAHEYIFLMTKSSRYFYDCDAIREKSTGSWNGSAFDGERDLAIHPNVGRKPRTALKKEALVGAHGTAGHDGNGMRMAEKWNNPAGRNKRSVWTMGSSPTPEAHFATFPLELPETCVLAGTSGEGRCSGCGAPLVRVVEREFQAQSDVSGEKGVRGANDQKPMDESNSWEGFPRGSTVTTTTGFEFSCGCKLPKEPCVVLDPFSGSGTTGLAALKHGRKYIGIELNPAYIAISHSRLLRHLPLLA